MLKNNFSQRVIEIVKKIPYGKVLTYGDVAMRAGSIGASRAVGSVMSKNKDKNVPCHRVVKSDGKIGQYNGLQSKTKGANAKLKLLMSEGVKFTENNKIIF